MEHLKERKKLYFRMTYALFIFLLLSMITIGGFYDGMLFGVALKPLAFVFVVLELLLLGYIVKMVLDEEKLESAAAPSQ